MATSTEPDAAWLDNPRAVKNVLKFLVSKLSPDDLEELDKTLTGESTATAMDARLTVAPQIQKDWLNYSPRDRKALRNSLASVPGQPMTMDQLRRADPMYGKTLDERFPDLKRLKGGY